MTQHSLAKILDSAQSVWRSGTKLRHGTNSGTSGGAPVEGFDREGMHLYAELLRNGRHGVMDSIYPLCKTVTGDKWHGIIDRYWLAYPPRHFNLNRQAEEFSSYLLLHESGLPDYLHEVAHYEWLELEIMELPVMVPVAKRPFFVDNVTDFVELHLVVNPSLRLHDYRFNVLKIADSIDASRSVPSHLAAPAPLNLAAFRPPGCGYCYFLELSFIDWLIVEGALEKQLTCGQLAKDAIVQSGDCPPEETSLKFIERVQELHRLGVLV